MICSKCKQTFVELTDQGICANCSAKADARKQDIIELARKQHQQDGQVEIDDNAQLSEGDDDGCYVSAWAWVDLSGTQFSQLGSGSILPAHTCENAVFPLGRLDITASARERLETVEVYAGLARHAHGDWGEVSRKDAEANNDALRSGGRIRSAYSDGKGTEFWIITEADRSVTTVWLAEY